MSGLLERGSPAGPPRRWTHAHVRRIAWLGALAVGLAAGGAPRARSGAPPFLAIEQPRSECMLVNADTFLPPLPDSIAAWIHGELPALGVTRVNFHLAASGAFNEQNKWDCARWVEDPASHGYLWLDSTRARPNASASRRASMPALGAFDRAAVDLMFTFDWLNPSSRFVSHDCPDSALSARIPGAPGKPWSYRELQDCVVAYLSELRVSATPDAWSHVRALRFNWEYPVFRYPTYGPDAKPRSDTRAEFERDLGVCGATIERFRTFADEPELSTNIDRFWDDVMYGYPASNVEHLPSRADWACGDHAACFGLGESAEACAPGTRSPCHRQAGEGGHRGVAQRFVVEGRPLVSRVDVLVRRTDRGKTIDHLAYCLCAVEGDGALRWESRTSPRIWRREWVAPDFASTEGSLNWVSLDFDPLEVDSLARSTRTAELAVVVLTPQRAVPSARDGETGHYEAFLRLTGAGETEAVGIVCGDRDFWPPDGTTDFIARGVGFPAARDVEPLGGSLALRVFTSRLPENHVREDWIRFANLEHEHVLADLQARLDAAGLGSVRVTAYVHPPYRYNYGVANTEYRGTDWRVLETPEELLVGVASFADLGAPGERFAVNGRTRVRPMVAVTTNEAPAGPDGVVRWGARACANYIDRTFWCGSGGIFQKAKNRFDRRALEAWRAFVRPALRTATFPQTLFASYYVDLVSSGRSPEAAPGALADGRVDVYRYRNPETRVATALLVPSKVGAEVAIDDVLAAFPPAWLASSASGEDSVIVYQNFLPQEPDGDPAFDAMRLSGPHTPVPRTLRGRSRVDGQLVDAFGNRILVQRLDVVRTARSR